MAQAIIDGDVGEGLRIINAAVDSGSDPRQFGQQLVEHLRALLITQTAGADMIEASPDERQVYTEQAGQLTRASLVRTIRAFNEAVNNYRGGWQPQLALELALIESLQPEPQPVVQVVQQAAGQAGQTSAPSEMVAPKPDASPVVASAQINEKWDRVLQAMVRYSKTSPELMRYFRALRVEGNVAYICTDNEVYFNRIQPYPEKRGVIEKALADVFRTPISVQIVKVTAQELASISSGGTVAKNEADSGDLLLSTGRELGAEIKRLDNS